jgi:hypothetical protein
VSVLTLSRLWLVLCATVEVVVLVVLAFSTLSATKAPDTVTELCTSALLIGVIAVQAGAGYVRRRGEHSDDDVDPVLRAIGSDAPDRIAATVARISAIQRSLVEALVAADEIGEQWARARRLAVPAADALRALALQFLAVHRAAALSPSPERERLDGAQRTVELRLATGLRDYEELLIRVRSSADGPAAGPLLPIVDRLATLTSMTTR